MGITRRAQWHGKSGGKNLRLAVIANTVQYTRNLEKKKLKKSKNVTGFDF